MVKVENTKLPPDASPASAGAPVRCNFNEGGRLPFAPPSLNSRTDGVASSPASSPLFRPGRASLPINLARPNPFSPSHSRFFLASNPHLTRILSRLLAVNMTYSDLLAVNSLTRPQLHHPSTRSPVMPFTITLYRQISVNNAYDRLITVKSLSRPRWAAFDLLALCAKGAIGRGGAPSCSLFLVTARAGGLINRPT